jgi:hypothetical protein
MGRYLTVGGQFAVIRSGAETQRVGYYRIPQTPENLGVTCPAGNGSQYWA